MSEYKDSKGNLYTLTYSEGFLDILLVKDSTGALVNKVSLVSSNDDAGYYITGTIFENAQEYLISYKVYNGMGIDVEKKVFLIPTEKLLNGEKDLDSIAIAK